MLKRQEAKLLLAMADAHQAQLHAHRARAQQCRPLAARRSPLRGVLCALVKPLTWLLVTTAKTVTGMVLRASQRLRLRCWALLCCPPLCWRWYAPFLLAGYVLLLPLALLASWLLRAVHRRAARAHGWCCKQLFCLRA